MTESEKLINIIRKTVREVIREELDYTKKQIITEIQSSIGGNSVKLYEDNSPKLYNKFAQGTPNTVVEDSKTLMQQSGFFAEMVRMKANDPEYIAQKMANR